MPRRAAPPRGGDRPPACPVRRVERASLFTSAMESPAARTARGYGVMRCPRRARRPAETRHSPTPTPQETMRVPTTRATLAATLFLLAVAARPARAQDPVVT